MVENGIVKIVAIGDSNTDLHYAHNMLDVTAYTFFLAELLKEVPPGNPIIVNKGKAGESTIDMYLRFQRDVVEERPSYVIIQGGTNDIGHIIQMIQTGRPIISELSIGSMHYASLLYDYPENDIHLTDDEKITKGVMSANNALEEMCILALQNRIVPILCTVPPYGREIDGEEGAYGRRAIEMMNSNIVGFCELNKNPPEGDPAPVVLADICTALIDDSGSMHPDFGGDIHLYTRGQAKVAVVLFKELTGESTSLVLPDGYKVSS